MFARIAVMLTLWLVSPRLVTGQDNWFLECTDAGSRFLAVVQYGETTTKRNASVVVFEQVDEGARYRQLHSTSLGNAFPTGIQLSPDGRFLITVDDINGSGVSNLTLAIYDLVRKEHSYFSLDDFLPKERRETLINHGFLPGLKWCHVTSGFNSKSTKFYPTTPAECNRERKHNIPFVEVDLPSRKVRVLPVPEVEGFDIIEPKLVRGKRNGELTQDGWIRSKQKTTGTFTLPKFYQRVVRSDPNNNHAWYYELHSSSGDYVKIDQAEKIPKEDQWELKQ